MQQLIIELPVTQMSMSFDKCYDQDPNYPGSIIITDLVTWNRYIKNNQDPVFQQHAYKLYQQYLLYKNYQNYLTKNLSTGHYVLSWHDFLLSAQKPKIDLNVIR
jgi:hypothetical protein